MFTCKYNSLVLVSCLKNLDIAFTVWVFFLSKYTKFSIKKAKTMMLVFLESFKRSSYGLH